MAGLMQKQISFEDKFKNVQILATGKEKLLFLVTPEAEGYLEELKIVEILIQKPKDQPFKLDKDGKPFHEVVTIDLNKVTLDFQNALGDFHNLFDLIFFLRHALSCDFEFKINDAHQGTCEILVVCKLPSSYILCAFVIFVEGDANEK